MANSVVDALAAAGRAEPAATVATSESRTERLGRLAAEAVARSETVRSTRIGAAHEVPETFRKFEGMVLQTFVQNMLPKESEAVYGGGLAGDMWKSFMATEIANVMTKAGGIGIADRVLREHYMAGERAIPVSGLPGVTEKSGLAEQKLLSTGLVQEMQRGMMKSLIEDASVTGRSTGD